MNDFFLQQGYTDLCNKVASFILYIQCLAKKP
jgi:hypothetical protein